MYWRNPVKTFQEEVVAVDDQAHNDEAYYSEIMWYVFENCPFVFLISDRFELVKGVDHDILAALISFVLRLADPIDFSNGKFTNEQCSQYRTKEVAPEYI